MRKSILTLMLFVLLLGAGFPSAAQDDTIHLSLSVPQFQEDLFRDTVAPQFEAAHPGIKLHIMTTDSFSIPVSPDQEIEEYLDDLAEYLSMADVALVDTSALSPEATRAGYLLDLTPLTDADTSLNVDDFYPALWEAFQWDGGLWGLPLSAEIQSIMYDPAAFDAAGLDYPDESWTLANYENAIRKLALIDASGTVTAPGLMNISNNLEALLIALLGDDVIDDSIQPAEPDYTNPALESLLTTWAELQKDGYVNYPNGEFNAPLLYGSTFIAAGGLNAADQRVPVPLPGGIVAANVFGFVVSSGTQYPEAAYALAKFLTNNPDVANGFFGSTSARRSLTGSTSTGVGGLQIMRPTTPEIDALNEQGKENALAGSNLRFARSLIRAIEAMNESGIDARTALENIEAEALARLETADERRSIPITVAAPELAPELAPGEIALKFGVSAPVMPFPNEDAWKAAAEAFAAEDPETGYIEIDTGFPETLESMTQKYDCFYQPGNLVTGGDLSLLRSMDPLMASDPSFDPSDYIGNVLSQVQVDNQTWAFPMTIQPAAMRYNPGLFEQAGAAAPENGTWTIDEFEQALRDLKAGLDGSAPFEPQGFDAGYLLSLIAAYGGLPIDYTTNPPTINFTDPATVEAIRQVLDLAREEYINYAPLTRRDRAFSMGGNAVPLYSEIFSFGAGGAVIMIGANGEVPTNPDLLVTYPTGSSYTPVTYDLGAGYISANTAAAEACYRFLSYISKRGDLFNAMPALHSVLNDPTFTASQNPDSLEFYNAIINQLSQPNVVSLPTVSPFSTGGGYILTVWLRRAFDRYVLEDATLETELAEAEAFTRAYQECAANPPDVARDTMEYFQFFNECATQVDPTIADAL
jgi:ABC-type glycerol-3-phosphate transport system substrate-binding protein